MRKQRILNAIEKRIFWIGRPHKGIAEASIALVSTSELTDFNKPVEGGKVDKIQIDIESAKGFQEEVAKRICPHDSEIVGSKQVGNFL